jgi:hypothetical protein
MARKTTIVTIDAAGRDMGKRFQLTEMSASQAEKWGMRAIAAIVRSGVDVPEHIAQSGMAGIMAVGLKSLFGADFRDAEPLLDELFACVKILPDAAHPGLARALVEEDIEEVATRLRLRSEVFELHTNFSVAAFLSKTWETAAARVRATEAMLNTPMSGGVSVQ